ncbi:MAG: hypothetical protein ACRDHG_10885 [Anaerolineales bacterium]
MLGPLAWLSSGLFILLLTAAIHRLLRTDRPALDLVALVFLLVFTTTLATFAAGVLGWLRPASMLVLSLAGIALLIATGSAKTTLAELRAGSRPPLSAIRDWWQGLPAWVRALTAAAAALSTVRFAFLIWALPPFVWDSLSYHLPNIAHWIQAGRIETFETPVSRIFNPANYEVLATWFAVFIRHDAVIEAAGIPAYLLATVAVYAAARGLGRGRTASTLAALAYGSTPAVILAATGTKNDIHIAAYYLVALAVVSDLTHRPTRSPHPKVLGKLMVLALALLLAIGTKTYIFHLIPGFILMGLLATQSQGRWVAWRDTLASGRKELRNLAPGHRAMLLALLACGLLLGAYWNVRNWVASGNPFYPYDVLLAGKTVFQGPESEFRLSLGELAANLENLAAKFGDRQDPIRPDLPNTTGWGWFSYSVGIPAVAWALIRRPRARPVVAGFVFSFLLLMLSTGPSPWNLRFAIWFPALFSLCFAEAADSMPQSLPRYTRLGLAGYLTILLSLNFVSTLNYNRVSVEEFRSMLALPVRDRHAAVFRDNMPDAYSLAVEVVPPGEELGYNVHGNGFVYPLYLADFSREIVYVPFSLDASCESIAAAMTERGTRYLLVAPEHTDDLKIAQLRACADAATSLRERESGIYVTRR